MSTIFESLESEVRSYCRSWPVVFERAVGHEVWDRDGNRYLDFFSGAGALSYGHNDPAMKEALVEHVVGDGITHSLDMFTVAKERFLERFHEVVLEPRDMPHRVMFPGPTGTNAVEAALKLARKATERESVVSFTNAFHGMTLGSLSVTGSSMKRQGAGVQLHNATNMPFEGYLGADADTLGYFEAFLEDAGSGVDTPAAVIVETVQAEGGINVASVEWLQRLQELCRRWEILLIVDDIQVGCGRTGPFFSYEEAGLDPDLICLSKSLSGYGLPMAVTLVRPEHDLFTPGEHNGTFRGHNLAFVTATAALDRWRDDALTKDVLRKGERVASALEDLATRHADLGAVARGRGLIQGLALEGAPALAAQVGRAAFERGMLLETSGPESEVVKLLPPLTIDDVALEEGLEIIDESLAQVASSATTTEVAS